MIKHYYQNPRFVLFKHKPGSLVSHVLLVRFPASEVMNESF